MPRRRSTAYYLLILTLVALIPFSARIATSATPHIMVPFTSYEELKQYILTQSCNGGRLAGPFPTAYNSVAGPSTLYGLSAGSGSTTPSHSETNAQVSGVDELDTVKNDGQYIYTVSNNTIAIVLAYPTWDARLVARVSVNGSLQGIFVQNNRLVVVSQESNYYRETIGPLAGLGVASPGVSSRLTYSVYPQFGETTTLQVFDISNHSNPVIKTTMVVNGTFAGARLIGDYVYLVATQPVFCYNAIVLPERVLNGHNVTVAPWEVYHSDVQDQAQSFTSIVSLKISQDNPSPFTKIFLIGNTGTIYVSLHDIYLTQFIWTRSQETVVHRIHIDASSINYEATGTVSGQVLDQFSMDEYNGYFRIATTSQSSGLFGLAPMRGQQQTNLYVMDRSLHIVGSLEGLSPGERMYSSRFMGDKAYLVTFKRTDPLFVIGLHDPSRPTVLGQLNITGVSDYLEPYDETHLIGFGKSAIDINWENAALFTGLKLSLFDVTDPNHPVEMSRYLMGDRGSNSPALTDHKAVLFDQSLNLLVIPVEIAKQSQNTTGTIWYWGSEVWQGAYVFQITLRNGLVFRGGITHLQNGETPNWNNNGQFITRALYIGNVLYTVSNDMVKMNSLSDLSELGSVTLA